MGCDIHYVPEIRFGEGPWHALDRDFGGARDYTLFARIAGVRNYEGGTTAIDDPRGLPDDVSKWTEEIMRNVDWHSHTWLTPKECDKATDWDRTGNFTALCRYIGTMYPYTEWRMIIAFDN